MLPGSNPDRCPVPLIRMQAYGCFWLEMVFNRLKRQKMLEYLAAVAYEWRHHANPLAA